MLTPWVSALSTWNISSWTQIIVRQHGSVGFNFMWFIGGHFKSWRAGAGVHLWAVSWAGTAACCAPAGEGRAGQNLLYCHVHVKKQLYFKRLETRKSIQTLKIIMSNLRKSALCGAGRSVFACDVKCDNLGVLHMRHQWNFSPSLFYPVLFVSIRNAGE